MPAPRRTTIFFIFSLLTISAMASREGPASPKIPETIFFFLLVRSLGLDGLKDAKNSGWWILAWSSINFAASGFPKEEWAACKGVYLIIIN